MQQAMQIASPRQWATRAVLGRRRPRGADQAALPIVTRALDALCVRRARTRMRMVRQNASLVRAAPTAWRAHLSLRHALPAGILHHAASRRKPSARSARLVTRARSGRPHLGHVLPGVSAQRWVRRAEIARAPAWKGITASRAARAIRPGSAVSLGAIVRTCGSRYFATSRAEPVGLYICASVAAIGRFNPHIGSTSYDSCILSRPGTHVSAAGAHDFIECAPGVHAYGLRPVPPGPSVNTSIR